MAHSSGSYDIIVIWLVLASSQKSSITSYTLLSDAHTMNCPGMALRFYTQTSYSQEGLSHCTSKSVPPMFTLEQKNKF